jgi:hypothetical protein
VVAKRSRQQPRTVDIGELAVGLRSQDVQVRLKALKRACPCRSGFTAYERLRHDIQRLQKDPDPGVRRAALHIVQEACEIERKVTELGRADDLGLRIGDTGWTAAQRRRQATGTWEPL